MNTYEMNLDLDKAARGYRHNHVILRQGDLNGTQIVATLYDHGEAFTTAGLTARFEMLLPDKEHYYREDAVYSAGVLTVNVDETYAASVPGETDVAYFAILSGSTIIATTEPFRVTILKCATDGMEVAESYDSAIQAAIDAIPDTIAAWLEEHPEATTTVEDGAVTDAKLAQTGGVLSDVAQLRDVVGLANPVDARWVDEGPGGIYHTTGETKGSTSFNHTGYVTVGDFDTITYQRVSTTATGSSFGMAFYSAEKSYISGEVVIRGAESYGYTARTIAVPSNAEYARFCTLASNVAGFSVTGVPTIIAALSSEVPSSRLAAGSVTEAKLAAGAVSDGKLSDFGVKSRQEAMRSVKLDSWQEWEQGNVKASGGVVTFPDSDTRYRCVVGSVDLISRIVVASGYEAGAFVYAPEGMTSVVMESFTRHVIELDAYHGQGYSVALVVRKVGETAITASEAASSVSIDYPLRMSVSGSESFVDTRKAAIDTVLHDAFDVEVTPAQVLANSLYFLGSPSYEAGVQTISGATLSKYTLDSSKTYVLTSVVRGATPGYPVVAYFDSSDNLVGYEWVNTQETTTAKAELEVLTPPSTAAWCYVNLRPTGDITSTSLCERKDTSGVSTQEIAILFVGNSLTQDGIAYLPYVLKAHYPTVRFRFYMWYNGGKTLEQQYQYFVNDTACSIFSVAENTSSWTNHNSSVKMSTILSTYTFDIVCMQEYFNYKDSYPDTTDWDNCREYIASNYAGENGLEFIALMHAPLRSRADAVFQNTVTWTKKILQDTIADDLIANGAAVWKALSTDLDSLGDEGHLSPDGTHTQEGLPCLMQTYVTLQWLLGRLGMPRTIYGLPCRMTTAIYDTLNVPGANLGSGVIVGTDAQNALAQRVAIWAYKYGLRVLAEGMPDATF